MSKIDKEKLIRKADSINIEEVNGRTYIKDVFYQGGYEFFNSEEAYKIVKELTKEDKIYNYRFPTEKELKEDYDDLTLESSFYQKGNGEEFNSVETSICFINQFKGYEKHASLLLNNSEIIDDWGREYKVQLKLIREKETFFENSQPFVFRYNRGESSKVIAVENIKDIKVNEKTMKIKDIFNIVVSEIESVLILRSKNLNVSIEVNTKRGNLIILEFKFDINEKLYNADSYRKKEMDLKILISKLLSVNEDNEL